MTNTTDQVLLDISDGIARVVMNRPDTSNGLDVPFMRDLHEAIMACHRHPDVRVVILRGEGKNFSGGGNVKDFLAQGENLPHYLREATSWLQLIVTALHRLSAPVIAGVHGFAAGGGGLGLVCAADIVIGTQNSHYVSGVARVGMAPDAGVSVTLAQLVGLRLAQEMLLTNRALSASEALECGLITKVVPDEELLDAVDAAARQIAASPPLAMAGIKRLLWEGLGSSVASRLSEEARTVAELSGTSDSWEGLVAVVEKRAPSFRGA